jgi:predicted DNA-binding WGR domain protein
MKILLIHNGGKHNKFWTATLNEDNSVTTNWGRLGTKGQSKIFGFGSEWLARDFIEKKTREKERKGYQELELAEFALEEFKAEIVGPEVKVNSLLFVQSIEDGQAFAKRRNVHVTSFTQQDKDIKFYEEVRGEALADPKCNPVILCNLTFTKKHGGLHFDVLITGDRVFTFERVSSATYDGSYWVAVGNVEEVTDTTDKILSKILSKAPSIVQAIVAQPSI